MRWRTPRRRAAASLGYCCNVQQSEHTPYQQLHYSLCCGIQHIGYPSLPVVISLSPLHPIVSSAQSHPDAACMTLALVPYPATSMPSTNSAVLSSPAQSLLRAQFGECTSLMVGIESHMYDYPPQSENKVSSMPSRKYPTPDPRLLHGSRYPGSHYHPGHHNNTVASFVEPLEQIRQIAPAVHMHSIPVHLPPDQAGTAISSALVQAQVLCTVPGTTRKLVVRHAYAALCTW